MSEEREAWIEQMCARSYIGYDWGDDDYRRYMETLSTHALERENEIEWVMRDPKRGNSRIMTVIVTFSAERVIVTGDFCPGRRGAISDGGYGIEWFTRSAHSPRYLAEKFLDKVWDRDVFRADLANLIKDMVRDAFGMRDRLLLDDAKRLRDEVLLGVSRYGSESEIFDTMSDIIVDPSDYSLGVNYPVSDMAMLAAIQHTFFYLFGKHKLRRSLY
jgi:hypothetical protein